MANSKNQKSPEIEPTVILKQLIEQAKRGNAGLIAISVATAEHIITLLEEK